MLRVWGGGEGRSGPRVETVARGVGGRGKVGVLRGGDALSGRPVRVGAENGSKEEEEAVVEAGDSGLAKGCGEEADGMMDVAAVVQVAVREIGLVEAEKTEAAGEGGRAAAGVVVSMVGRGLYRQSWIEARSRTGSRLAMTKFATTLWLWRELVGGARQDMERWSFEGTTDGTTHKTVPAHV
jgi:hypothetical protein